MPAPARLAASACDAGIAASRAGAPYDARPLRNRTLSLGVVLVALAGCGGGSKPPRGGEAAKPPDQILRDATAALRRVHSLRIAGTMTIGGRRTTIDAEVERQSAARMTLRSGSRSAALVVIGGDVYIKANAAFFKQQGSGAQAALLADRWLKVPASAAGGSGALTKSLDPARLGRCLGDKHGTLTRGATTTIGGRAAIAIVDKGDRPGATPSTLYVATSGAPLPLRAVATGAERPGGRGDPTCNTSRGDRAHAGDELSFSDYDRQLHIAAPHGAIDLSHSQGGGSTIPAALDGPPARTRD